MVSLNIVLGRVACELEGLATRLSQLTLSQPDRPNASHDLSVAEIVALQEIDHAEQVSRSLASVVGALALSCGKVDLVDTDMLTVGLPLESLQLALSGRPAGRDAGGDLDLF